MVVFLVERKTLLFRALFSYVHALLIVLSAALVGWSDPSYALDLGPRPIFREQDYDQALLGRLLFYDPILSGNKNISCASCHHPDHGTSDGVSLSLGEGGVGLGPNRIVGDENEPQQRIPRNSPGLWNLGAEEFQVFFHDGRLEADPKSKSGIRTPLGADMSVGFDSALSAQAMFPVLSPDEMAGHYSENDVAQAVRMGLLSQPSGAWDIIAKRVEKIPFYSEAFARVGVEHPIRFTDIANVIAEFIEFEWRADASPFDIAMTGGRPLSKEAQQGLDLFYGTAGCSVCHSGWFQTDHQFHSIAMPQIGPGKAARFESHARDEGRKRVTGKSEDSFAFRTPSLRNVTLTAPYGHSGAFSELEQVIRHHLSPEESFASYDPAYALLPDFSGSDDFRIMADTSESKAIIETNVLAPMPLTDEEIASIVSFLEALEDPAERLGVPELVPSGLPVER